MCGFCGFSGQLVTEDAHAVLEKMKQRIRHRGPDDANQYIDEQVALGFRRLSIIDLEHGVQPMATSEGDLRVVFNGEIYNYQVLRQELEALGHVFQTQSDTETLLHGYREWGQDLPQHLRGMFAFVIYDSTTQRLFGARDYFGIKPFYYSMVEGHFVFASEIKAILEFPNFKRQVNQAALEEYLTFQYSALDQTFFEGVYKLAPAHSFVFEQGKLTIRRYWQATFDPDEAMSLDEAVAGIQSVMQDSVKTHQIADVEVGSLLSGGVDSSLIAALGRPDKTFSVGFDYETFNEIPYAEALSEELGIQNYSQVISTEAYWQALPFVQYYLDEPLADASAVALYFVNKLARQQVKVIMSGEGSDEFFGGYTIYHEPVSLAGYQTLPKGFRKLMGRLAEKYLPQGMKGRSFLIRGGQDLAERFIGNANRFSYEARQAILKHPGQAPHPMALTAPYYEASCQLDQPTQMQLIDIHFWLIGDILLKGDKMSMANSVESRVPFLDKAVFEVARKIPTKHRLAQGTTKFALRQAAQTFMPEESAGRKKLGFPVPLATWLRTDCYYEKVKTAFNSQAAATYFNLDVINQLLEEHRMGEADHSKHIWTIYMFLVWYEVYFEHPITFDQLDQMEIQTYVA